MFYQSYQNLSFQQHIIGLTQSYPCPRCSAGALETFGLTETLKCNTCNRAFVALRGGRLLYPANHLGIKIAPTFWWDGLRWHWAGTTATTRNCVLLIALFVIPLTLLNIGIYFDIWSDRPEWCNPLLLTSIIGLLNIQLIYFMCWDFNFNLFVKRKSQKAAS